MPEQRPSIPPESVALCPACGKPVDVLRAGHVAILGGRFFYFCDASCKADYVRVLENASSLEGETAEPPRVAEVAPVPSSRAPRTPRSPAATAPAFPEVAPASSRPTSDAPPSPPDSGDLPMAPPSIDLGQIPASEASPQSRAPISVIAAPARDLRLWLSGAAIALGTLAAIIALAGALAAPVRLPLAALAFVAFITSELVRKTDVAEPALWVRLAPALVAISAAACAAVLPSATSGAHALRLASLAGLVCASLAVSTELAARARKSMQDARFDLARRLDVTCKLSVADEITVVPCAQVKPGDLVVLEAGDTAGVDGVITAGEAEAIFWLDSQTTGTKREGDPIVAGARVLSGKIKVLATFTGGDRAYARSVSSSLHRADSADPQLSMQRRVLERAVLPVAALAGVFAFAAGVPWPDAIATAACALAASQVPGLLTAMAVCLGRGQLAALARGIAYKDGRAFDLASKVDVAVVCSRGTVLLGEPELVTIESLGLPEGRVLSLAAGAETSSTHPFAAAILHAAKSRGETPEAVRSAVTHAGLGVTALASTGDRIVVGGRAFLLKEKVSIAVAESNLAALEAQGRSVLLVAFAGKLVGLLALQDGLRPGARAAMRRLHDARIEPVLLSGESRDTCETIARALEIDHVRPEVLSLERGAEVRALRDGGHVVAVLGHAATDDGALGGADVAVALLALGTTPAEWGVALASDDVRDAALSLTLPRIEKERSRRALLFGLVLPVTAILGAALGVVPLELAPIAGVGALLVSLWVSRADPS